MTYAEMRELVRIRHDLRRATAEGRREDARVLMERLRNLAERDPDERRDIEPEIERWEAALDARN